MPLVVLKRGHGRSIRIPSIYSLVVIVIVFVERPLLLAVDLIIVLLVVLILSIDDHLLKGIEHLHLLFVYFILDKVLK